MVLKPLVKVSVQIVVLYQYGILDSKYLPMLIAGLMYKISTLQCFISLLLLNFVYRYSPPRLSVGSSRCTCVSVFSLDV